MRERRVSRMDEPMSGRCLMSSFDGSLPCSARNCCSNCFSSCRSEAILSWLGDGGGGKLPIRLFRQATLSDGMMRLLTAYGSFDVIRDIAATSSGRAKHASSLLFLPSALLLARTTTWNPFDTVEKGGQRRPTAVVCATPFLCVTACSRSVRMSSKGVCKSLCPPRWSDTCALEQFEHRLQRDRVAKAGRRACIAVQPSKRSDVLVSRLLLTAYASPAVTQDDV